MSNKRDAADESDTDYVDIDLLFRMYTEKFIEYKEQYQKKMYKAFKMELLKATTAINPDVTPDTVSNLVEGLASRSQMKSTVLSFGGQICQLRALIYAFMCGTNGLNITENEFVAGCSRFGLDNPVPIITRRFRPYGNEEAIEVILAKEAKKYNNTDIIDPEKFGTQV